MMKRITENVSHTKGNGMQCKNRYHEKRTPEKAKGVEITKSEAVLNNRCKISAVHVCGFKNYTHKDCPLSR
jgi:hypothetical protein